MIPGKLSRVAGEMRPLVNLSQAGFYGNCSCLVFIKTDAVLYPLRLNRMPHCSYEGYERKRHPDTYFVIDNGYILAWYIIEVLLTRR